MLKTSSFLRLAFLSGVAMFIWAGFSHAQYRGYRPWPIRPPIYRPIYPPNRMPGWDWWRTYPWSPYNYGRNPYYPARNPYYPYRPYYGTAVAPLDAGPVN
jgi:hypothetical protein